MHHIYTTKALIIKSFPIGEANKYYFLLTEDLGFIKATAQSVRSGKSKMNGHLQEFCLVKISLVKGKNVWRIVGVDTLESKCFIKDNIKLISVKNIFSLLIRLLHGEEKNISLFESVYVFYNFLQNNNLTKEKTVNLEIITVLRILYNLGYFKNDFELISFVENNNMLFDILDLFTKKKDKAIVHINEALKETHL